MGRIIFPAVFVILFPIYNVLSQSPSLNFKVNETTWINENFQIIN